ncbi:MAG: DUF5320 domain-containing protein [Candidatus Aminicenantes bacterium]|nr:DUF5320 domain-containing protein [Candidatus Aminicenantes bacterium]
MPRGDRTGPMGMGPMTGRAAGSCAGYGMPGFMNPAFGRGRGPGFGRGLGFGRGGGFRGRFYTAGAPGWTRFAGYTAPYVKPDPEMERQALRNEAADLQAELEAVKKRLSDLEAGAGAE